MWEYFTDRDKSEDDLVERLNKYGEEDWELVAVTSSPYGFTAFLKRPKQKMQL